MRWCFPIGLVVSVLLPCASLFLGYQMTYPELQQSPVHSSEQRVNCDASGYYIFEDIPSLGAPVKAVPDTCPASGQTPTIVSVQLI